MRTDAPSSTSCTVPYEAPGVPTAEALFATRVAGEVARQLFEAGQELRFSLAPDPERVVALLCDTDGIVLSRLTPSRVLEIASGAFPSAAFPERGTSCPSR